MAFKKRLRAYRIAQKLSYEELALLCNVTPWTIRRWELGLGKANEEQIAKLIKLLHIPEEISENSMPIKQRMGKDKSTFFKGCEYTSSCKVFGIPLLAVQLGLGRNRNGKRRIAKGIIAIGNTAVGVISLGMMSFGILSFGLLSFGFLFCLGVLAIGVYALGALAIGYISVGTLAIGMYSIGVISIGFEVSFGIVAYGHLTIGTHAFGDTMLLLANKQDCYLDSTAMKTVMLLLAENDYPFLIRFLLTHIPICI